MFRILTKKYYLPVKYYFIIRRKAKSSDVRHKEDIYLKSKQISSDLIVAQREGTKEEVAIQTSKLKLINWVLNK